MSKNLYHYRPFEKGIASTVSAVALWQLPGQVNLISSTHVS
jgi:hypothetical protein